MSQANDTKVTGRCFCGAVRFRFAEGPITARTCWCRDCQYLSCGNASVNAVFSVKTFEREGDIGVYESTADSGNTMRRSFCPKCGTPLFSQAQARPDIMVVRAGALDDPSVARPTGTIWRASAPPWGLVDPDLPAIDGQPAPVVVK